jgi:PAS domain S-box-containing protein
MPDRSLVMLFIAPGKKMAPSIKRTLLLVEDDKIVALVQKAALESFGYQVVPAESGENAVEIVSNRNDIDLILMDIDLGSGMNGPQTAQEILKSHNIPVVFLSSHTSPAIVALTETISSYGYVVKNSGITVLDASIKMAFKLFDANQKIRKSESIQKAMITNISDIIGIMDANGIIQYKSPNLEKWFGWTPQDRVGQNVLMTVHPDDQERIKGAFSQLISKDHASIAVEYRYLCKNGSYKPVELTATHLPNDPEIHGVLLNYHDISERRRLESALEKRMVALSRPLDETGQIKFQDFFDPLVLQRIQDEFAAATGVAAILTYPDGTPITRPSNYTRLCDEVVRNSPTGCAHCTRSKMVTNCNSSDGPVLEQCPGGGLWNAGVSISVGEQHLANWLIGQVREKSSTDDKIRDFARRAGVNENEAAKAFAEVPIMSRDRFQQVAQSLFTLTNQLSLNAVQNMHQARLIRELQQTAKELRETKAILEASMDQNPAGIAIADAPSGNLRYVNNAGLLIRGGSRQSIVDGVGINEYVASWKILDLDGTPLKSDEVPLARAVLYGETSSREFMIRRENNDDRIVLANAAPILDEQGKVSAGVVVFLDITESKRLQEINLESGNRFRQMVSDMHVGVILQGPQAEIILGNPQALTLLGLTEDQLLGKTSFDPDWNVIHEDGSPFPGPTHPVPQAIATRKPVHDVVMGVYRPVPGDRVWLSVDAEPQFNLDGSIKQVVCTFINITERKNIEATLQEREEGYQTLANSGQALIWLAGTDKLCYYFNQVWFEFTGRTNAQEQGNGWAEGVHPDDLQKCLDIYTGSFDRREKFSMEYRLRRHDGEYRWLLDDGAPRYNSHGEFLGYIGHCLDITERKVAEDAVKNLLTEKELILKEVHHRIKNNMNTVHGLLSLQISYLKEPTAIAALSDAGNRVLSMMVLYDKLYNSTSFNAVSASQYIPPLVHEILSNFPQDAKIKTEMHIEDFTINVKRLQPLGIIINELITNIMKYAFVGSTKEGLISVSTTLHNNRVSLSVRDNGIGMPESIDLGHSTGFGLNLISMLTRQLRGTVRVEREGGTNVIVEFEK